MVSSLNFKKLMLVPVLLLFSSLSMHVNAQKPNIDFKFKVDSVAKEGITIYNVIVTITIIKGEPEYIYSIATDAPWNGGRIIKESAAISEKQYTFESIPSGRYFIMVKDKANEKASYQYITIPASK